MPTQRNILAIGLFASIAAPALAQAIYMDTGNAALGAPSSAYAAASGQAGFWNSNLGSSIPLKDASGATTPVTYLGSGGVATVAVPGATGDELAMMRGTETFNSSNSARFSHLTPGQYDVYIYMWGGSLLGPESPICTLSTGGAQVQAGVSYTSQWPGQQVLGETYCVARVNVLPQFQLLSMSFSHYPGDYTVVNGIQLVPVPAPGLALLPLAGLLASRRRR